MTFLNYYFVYILTYKLSDIVHRTRSLAAHLTKKHTQVFQCSGDDMNMVLTGGVTPATSPKVLSPGTLVSPPPPAHAHAPRLLAHHIAHQSLLARQHENLLLASLRPSSHPLLPVLPAYSIRSPSPATPYPIPQILPQQTVLPTKRTYDRAFTQTEAAPAKRQYVGPQVAQPSMSLPVFSYSTSAPMFSYANTSPMLSTYASGLHTIPTALPAGYGAAALSAALPGAMTSPFPATALSMSMFPTYPYYPGM